MQRHAMTEHNKSLFRLKLQEEQKLRLADLALKCSPQ